MKVGIYSARPQLLTQMGAAVGEFSRNAYLSLTVRAFSSPQALMAGLSDAPLDILFYDTEESDTPREDLHRVRHSVPNCALVLVCDDARHALMGYSVKAADYLLTPLTEEDLIRTLSQLLRQRMEQGVYYLPIKVNGVWSRLNMQHITYLESAGHSLIFHMNDGRSFRTIAHYRDYDGLLEMNPDFFRCHKSYVVNMRYVTQWDQNCLTLADGSAVNISRPYRQMARSMYACYVTQSRDTVGANDG